MFIVKTISEQQRRVKHVVVQTMCRFCADHHTNSVRFTYKQGCTVVLLVLRTHGVTAHIFLILNNWIRNLIVFHVYGHIHCHQSSYSYFVWLVSHTHCIRYKLDVVHDVKGFLGLRQTWYDVSYEQFMTRKCLSLDNQKYKHIRSDRLHSYDIIVNTTGMRSLV